VSSGGQRRRRPHLTSEFATFSGMISRLRLVSVGGAFAAMLIVGACSASSADFQSAAEKVIEGDIAEQSTLGELSATCEEPDDPQPGDVFACTATTEDGRTIEFTATVEEDDKVNVLSTNLITVEGLGTVEEIAVAALEAEIGQTLGAENFDCGAEPVIIDLPDGTLTCALTDPGNGDVYDAEVTIPSLDDVGSLTVQVADAPRP
jgi:hypothetical protein